MVSVIIPAYNRGNTIRKSAESVLRQTYKEIELILINDGSIDNTYEVIKDIEKSDDRVVVIDFKSNKGACAARNAGIRAARGEYIAFNDSDDVWVNDKLEKQLKAMDEFGADICFAQIDTIKNGVNIVKPTNYTPGLQDNVDTVYNITTGTLLIKKDVIINNLFDESLPRLQEFELLLRIAQKYSLFFLKMPLVHMSTSDNSISKQKDSLIIACEYILNKHPRVKNDYPQACFQIAKMLVVDSVDARWKMRMRMLKDALKYDHSLKLIARIPYHYFMKR